MERPIGNPFKVGDGVSWGCGSDREAGTVVAVTPSSVSVVEDKATLLNGVDSGESDALKCYPGGYSYGHIEGIQRYRFSPGTGAPIRFSLRYGLRRFKMVGTSVRGSMGSWGILSAGRSKHHNYNF